MINYNDAFNSAKLIPGAHRYLPGWKKKSKAFREMMGEQSKSQIDVVYDEDENLSMDIFSPGPYVEATVVFLHGGFWTDYEKSIFSYLAMGPVLNKLASHQPQPISLLLPYRLNLNYTKSQH